MGWCESARFQILRFSEILPEEWVPGGIIILARETKIAEMKLSEPYKNDFQFSKKSIKPKLKIFEWEIGENLKKSGKFPDVMRQNPEIWWICVKILYGFIKTCTFQKKIKDFF